MHRVSENVKESATCFTTKDESDEKFMRALYPNVVRAFRVLCHLGKMRVSWT
jgi:hypothetical protein